MTTGYDTAMQRPDAGLHLRESFQAACRCLIRSPAGSGAVGPAGRIRRLPTVLRAMEWSRRRHVDFCRTGAALCRGPLVPPVRGART